ncbi:MAG: hypothetical protein H6754_06050 [Candidatus Omnitrophica bacterium]|nr:hypothetical protein [Candidatus Omnitrophota bacterium]
MKIASVFVSMFLILSFVPATIAAPASNSPVTQSSDVLSEVELSQFIYSYGTVLKVSPTEIVLQEYDYDSDVEKEVIYQVDPAVKFDGFATILNLVAQDVVEVYYLEQDGKKIAKIIRQEAIEEDPLDTASEDD